MKKIERNYDAKSQRKKKKNDRNKFKFKDHFCDPLFLSLNAQKFFSS